MPKILIILFLFALFSEAKASDLSAEQRYFQKLTEHSFGYGIYKVSPKFRDAPLDGGVSHLLAVYYLKSNQKVNVIPETVETSSSTGEELHIFYNPPKEEIRDKVIIKSNYDVFPIDSRGMVSCKIEGKRHHYSLVKFIWLIASNHKQ